MKKYRIRLASGCVITQELMQEEFDKLLEAMADGVTVLFVDGVAVSGKHIEAVLEEVEHEKS
ncbi:hypothetical protein [Streptococcus hyointestinalis]